jgi:hypothetical protein
MNLKKYLAIIIIAVIIMVAVVGPAPIITGYSSNLKAFYDFTNGSVSDLSTNGNNGTIFGSPASTTSPKGDALLFTGTEYIRVNDSASLNFGSGDFAFSLWFKTASTQTNNTILDKRLASDQGYHFTLYTGKPCLQISNGTQSYNFWQGGSTISYNDNKWHFIEVSVDRDSTTGIKFYMDNTLIYTANPTGITGNLTNNVPLSIGKHRDYSNYNFVGSLDNICIYNACVTGVNTNAEYNTYYGHLHNHTNVSDGTGTPSQAYAYARDTAKLDFFGLADHSNMITSTEWTDIKNAANAYNSDGNFATFYGFEWTSSANYGHVAVINSDDYCSHTDAATDTFTELVSWLSTRDAVAFFNHPGRENGANREFEHFQTTPSNKFVGMELWNKTVGFSTFYYNDGYYTNDGGKNFFNEALTRGWKIGASGSDDNHTATWGTDTDSRMAVLSKSKTRASIFEALKAKRFYSTLDKNLSLSFEINGNQMGSTMSAGNNYSGSIKASDADSEIFTEYTFFMNDFPLSTMPVNSTTIDTGFTIGGGAGNYYYVRVKQLDGGEAISSPIFFN